MPLQPELRAGSKEIRQSRSGVGADAAPALHDLVHPGIGELDPMSQLGLGHAQRLAEFIQERLGWVIKLSARDS